LRTEKAKSLGGKIPLSGQEIENDREVRTGGDRSRLEWFGYNIGSQSDEEHFERGGDIEVVLGGRANERRPPYNELAN
jgi:hypothetical protein